MQILAGILHIVALRTRKVKVDTLNPFAVIPPPNASLYMLLGPV
jgi:hypothetical protein